LSFFDTSESLAEKFHDIYNRLAPRYGEIKHPHPMPWYEIPVHDRALLTAIMAELISDLSDYINITHPYLHHDEQTMRKVFDALESSGCSKEKAAEIVHHMQNNGILFREVGHSR
jgi:hypothetical protein